MKKDRVFCALKAGNKKVKKKKNVLNCMVVVAN